MSSPGFQDWLREVSRHFVGLSPEERVGTLLHLMTQCDTQEKFQWQQQLSQHLYRDILVWIPPEIAHKILSYLDARSLLHATLVSKAWHATVSRDKVLWDRMEEQLGIKFKHSKRYVRTKVNHSLSSSITVPHFL